MFEVCEVEREQERECQVVGCEERSEFTLIVGGGPSEKRVSTERMHLCGWHGFKLNASFSSAVYEWYGEECKRRKEESESGGE